RCSLLPRKSSCDRLQCTQSQALLATASLDSVSVTAAAPESVLLETAWLPAAERPLERADMLLQDGSIAAIGVGLDMAGRDARRVDASGHLVIPGVTNAQTH